ncbi:serine/threonine-protein kinase [Streptomyces sp. LHD-70]|uniref:serine/threonine-protein kinase n=1 Tax=Streptomyces sp. LHD-70 TaxID=3072140 RepID=UPI00280F4F05|nr:serine/threonine-protein kinase [Streptomyces sp. LHD-70]MDQ8705030.1 serine/threonine-protein kinase [Streptomyces sp. LHD-70]
MGLGSTPPIDVPDGYRVGPWRINGPIGSGSWGSVYAAEHGADGTRAAVKFLRTDLLTPGQRGGMEELVAREVRFSLEADHPNLVRTHAAHTVRDRDRPELDGLTALVMDRAEHNLQELLTAEPGGPGPLPSAERILEGVAAGLAHLHGRGWVHGDLKPANVLLAYDGSVWLADFGLTAELDGTHAYVPPLGTLDHVPPEWWSERTGAQGTKVRPSADIWAFGVVAHQVLSGGLHPFPGSTARARALAAQAYARGGAPLRLDESVPQAWRELIAACLRPDHGSRSRMDSAQLASRVRELAGPGRRSGRRVRGRRGRQMAVLLAAAATVLAAATGSGLLPLTEQTDNSAPTDGRSRQPPVSAQSLSDRADVPRALRPHITNTAMRCADEAVTPALIAAILKAESDFDVDAHRVRRGKDGIEVPEHGVAMWTPEVFRAWAKDGDGDGRTDYMNPPDAIATLGSYLCYLAGTFREHGMTADIQSLMAAAYRTSGKVVRAEGGVPERTRGHVGRVRKYLAAYAE